ncbi:hypothetical protein AVV30_gp082 [Vibrio phage phi 1]|uniref:Uncharacterized protein n=1 Tax=Vibrio phage phi 1 TaxID=1589297 RepID=A0A0B5HE18_9CAUD|nr:hypothetical protein AVV30_gp082 [Vibrio phage phi 1]AJF40740.1 hypothetical protein SBVP1_0082 [Vibrio phage phi 1]
MDKNQYIESRKAIIEKTESIAKLQSNKAFKLLMELLDKEALVAGKQIISGHEVLKEAGLTAIKSVAWFKQHLDYIQREGEIAKAELTQAEEIPESEFNQEYEG